jgi:hypothetical protein
MTPVPFNRMTEVAVQLEDMYRPALTYHQAEARACELLLWLSGNSVNGQADWKAALDLVSFGRRVQRDTYPAGEPEPYSPPRPDAIAQRLADVFAEVCRDLGDDAPVPPNHFLVGKRGEDVMVGMPVAGRLSKGTALILATWLVALADPQLKTFAPMLAKVLST